MRIRRYNDGNVFSALIDKIKSVWVKWKGTVSNLSWGRKIAYIIGTVIKCLAMLAQGINFAAMTKALVQLRRCKKQLEDVRRQAESEGDNEGKAAAAFGLGVARSTKSMVINTVFFNSLHNLLSFGIGAAMQYLADNTKRNDSWNYGRKVVDTNACIDYVLRAM